MKKRSFILVVFLLICSVFCLSACQGEQGVTGETGQKGEPGDKGPTGDKGATGQAGKDAGNYDIKVEGDSIYYAYENEEGEKEWLPVISLYDLFAYERTYTITLIANGGTLYDSNVMTDCVYNEYVEVEEPTREGYTFLGWYDEYGNLVETIFQVNRDYTLVARWETIDGEGE